MNLLRTVSLLALSGAALSAYATDAFSNLLPGPEPFDNVNGFILGASPLGGSVGSQFTATRGGTLSGFTLGLTILGDEPSLGYTLRLYADSGSNTLGALLGVFDGIVEAPAADGLYPLSVVRAPASGLRIDEGSKYWLVAGSTEGNPGWFLAGVNGGNLPGLMYGEPGRYFDFYSTAFSVQVDAVPGPTAALPFALLALRRRKRA